LALDELVIRTRSVAAESQMGLLDQQAASVPSTGISLFGMRAWLGMSRHRLVVLVLVAALPSAVAVHHGNPMAMHMPGGVCLAIFAGAVVLAWSRCVGRGP